MFTYIQEVIDIKVILLMIKKKVKVFCTLKMEINMMEIGKKEWKMDKESTSIKTVIHFKEALKGKEEMVIVYIRGNRM